MYITVRDPIIENMHTEQNPTLFHATRILDIL
jgi:hypothetical protein